MKVTKIICPKGLIKKMNRRIEGFKDINDERELVDYVNNNLLLIEFLANLNEISVHYSIFNKTENDIVFKHVGHNFNGYCEEIKVLYNDEIYPDVFATKLRELADFYSKLGQSDIIIEYVD